MNQPLPLPPHYDPLKVNQVWRVPYQERASQAVQWVREHNIRPAAADRVRIGLVAIDVQNTFCIPGYELFVGGRSGNGAVEDNQRLCAFIYRNLGVLTQITPTMDTHHTMQIFHPIFLVNDRGEHPDPLTIVSYQDVVQGKWKFNARIAESIGITAEDGQKHLLYYTKELLERQKYSLTIWPYHAMLGGIGHALVSAVEESIFFHTIARNTQPNIIVKGQLARTESYSAIGPEVLTDSRGTQFAEKNSQFLQLLYSLDMVIVAGQAKSHCVAWTIDDWLEEIMVENPSLAKKIYLLEDCTSPVVVPGIVDYTEAAESAFNRFAAAGMHIVRSTTPISSWPHNNESRPVSSH